MTNIPVASISSSSPASIKSKLNNNSSTASFPSQHPYSSHQSDQNEPQTLRIRTVILFLVCVAGIYASYLTQGVVSEQFAVTRYGSSNERFVHLESLNGAQAVACFIWAFLLLQFLQMTGHISRQSLPPWHAYWKAGITNSVGPACGMFALKNITYSAQVLAKSCKMVPVMLMGSILHGKTYNGLEYLCMSLIGVGVALFARRGSGHSGSKLARPNGPLGYFLCLANLALDGYTNAAQDEINHRFPANSPIHMMCFMNLWTAAYYGVYLFILNAKAGGEVVAFLIRHPEARYDVALFCVCGAAGQLFIFFTIKTFGSLCNTLVCTTRKFFNILLSVAINKTPLDGMQWSAVGMVFTGLITSSLGKAYSKKKIKTTAAPGGGNKEMKKDK
uniref:UDP-galactose transporter n=1 Tax=Polytomella parva TaxID=51329 RepID=A0A7S0UWS0_9CHLO|mmetsp:Transcript_20090/g.36111  ORF Transcript_20090/g.36111 Transcript_20090/m.36111 type:complete len:389 (+) Transcript_20090:195-1361(+)|eukprot:CAMPEP_0175053218 /NCGR_PEP_ID=MMETSP0052_2-20121109/8800_1 /TAXON_ID=51329 ORGANISM="Polytomella parva, Strain SAG 63-3" /NCGR_SAMPLE_ID=MMETSP0052_2 /ASSEMBLY_ACC=CAM_ASM_000194 /LENGTH=388 /DNA_ID=CAMNT_0016317723 /DNA_START=140 /DNA_END=1306 /DNA_ORIENTATION=+